MGRIGLHDFFSFDAFGDLADRREDLIDIALVRVAEYYERSLNLSDLVLIGPELGRALSHTVFYL